MREAIHVPGRRRLGIPAAVALALLLAALAHASPAEPAAFRGKVVGVSDGDTITVLHDGHPERIRLHGIDAPEKGQAFSARARQFAASLALGREVVVRVTDRDRYGRTVAEVILPDGRSLNRELVRAGYAWWFRRYSADGSLGTLESEARRRRAGLWADPQPQPPWEWRDARRAAAPR